MKRTTGWLPRPPQSSVVSARRSNDLHPSGLETQAVAASSAKKKNKTALPIGDPSRRRALLLLPPPLPVSALGSAPQPGPRHWQGSSVTVLEGRGGGCRRPPQSRWPMAAPTPRRRCGGAAPRATTCASWQADHAEVHRPRTKGFARNDGDKAKQVIKIKDEYVQTPRRAWHKGKKTSRGHAQKNKTRETNQKQQQP